MTKVRIFFQNLTRCNNVSFQMIKMLIVVVACYTVCWLPFNIYWVIGLAEESIYIHPSYPYTFTVVHILAVSHTCYNPFIYCWMNIRVRQGFLEVLGKYEFKSCATINTNLYLTHRQMQLTQKMLFLDQLGNAELQPIGKCQSISQRTKSLPASTTNYEQWKRSLASTNNGNVSLSAFVSFTHYSLQHHHHSV